MKKIFTLFIFFFCFSVNALNKFSVKFDKCIDGDTARFFINGESKTVRFLSINAPEIAHDDILEEYYGEESSNYTCKLLSRANSIKLQYDPKSDRTDKFGRVLAWVFIDDELLQKKLVSKGYAEVKYVYNDYLYSNELKELEATAKEKKLGMWNYSDVELEKSDVIPVSLHDILACIIILLGILILYFLKRLFK